MSQLSGLYAIWLREVKVFFREYSRLIGSVLTPLLWLVVVGKGIGASIEDEASFGGYGYDTFIFPGILCMTVLFQSLPNQCRCVVALVYHKCSAVAQSVVDSPAYLAGVAAVGRRIALEPLGTEETVDFCGGNEPSSGYTDIWSFLLWNILHW